MTSDIWLVSSVKLTVFVLLDRCLNRSRYSDNHVNSGRLKGRKGVRPTTPGQDDVHILVGQELRCLNPDPACCGKVGIVQNLKVHGLRIDKNKVRASSKARINRGV
jgi:hypothetical protein